MSLLENSSIHIHAYTLEVAIALGELSGYLGLHILQRLQFLGIYLLINL